MQKIESWPTPPRSAVHADLAASAVGLLRLIRPAGDAASESVLSAKTLPQMEADEAEVVELREWLAQITS